VRARRALFLALFPEPRDRPKAAARLLGGAGGPLSAAFGPRQFGAADAALLASARLWRDDNALAVEAESGNYGATRPVPALPSPPLTRQFYSLPIHLEKRLARQFLVLHGGATPATTAPCVATYQSALEWNTRASNAQLRFSRDGTAAERPGSVSCYPAAFADLPGDRCCLTVALEAAPRSTNWLTFGLCRRVPGLTRCPP